MYSSRVAWALAWASAEPVSLSLPSAASCAATSASVMLMPRLFSASRSPSMPFWRMSATSAALRVPPVHSDRAPERPITSVDMPAAWSRVNPIGTRRSPMSAARPTAARDVRPMALAFSAAHACTPPRLEPNTVLALASICSSCGPRSMISEANPPTASIIRSVTLATTPPTAPMMAAVLALNLLPSAIACSVPLLNFAGSPTMSTTIWRAIRKCLPEALERPRTGERRRDGAYHHSDASGCPGPF